MTHLLDEFEDILNTEQSCKKIEFAIPRLITCTRFDLEALKINVGSNSASDYLILAYYLISKLELRQSEVEATISRWTSTTIRNIDHALSLFVVEGSK